MNLSIVFVLFLGPLFVNAASIRLAFSGTVNEIVAGDRFSMGSDFRVEMDYEVPVNADVLGGKSFDYFLIPTNSRLVIAGVSFEMIFLNVSGSLNPTATGEEWLIYWSTSTFLSGLPFPPYQYNELTLTLRIPEDSVDDPGRIPSSLDGWDLNGGTFDVDFYTSEDVGGFEVASSFRSSTLSEISLTTIPEPGVAFLVMAGGIWFGVRRRFRVCAK